MKVEIKNSNFNPNEIKSLFDYIIAKDQNLWEYMGMKVELDPTFDFETDNSLIRWIDRYEGFNDKIIVSSLSEFKKIFKEIYA